MFHIVVVCSMKNKNAKKNLQSTAVVQVFERMLLCDSFM